MPFVIYNEKEYKLDGNYLDLQSKGIKDITLIEGLENLTNLEALNLRNNQISEIKGLDMLINLKRLYLSENEITEIRGLDKLHNLEFLDLSENQIAKIEGLDALQNLTQINLVGNQMEDPEEEYLVQKTSNPQEYVEKCKFKKIDQNIPFIKFNNQLSFQENIEDFEKKHRGIADSSFFVSIGTHKELKQIKAEQNAIFLFKKPNEIQLSEREINEYKDIIIHLIQLHSLKGIEFKKKNKIEYFNFFIRHFWNDNEIEKNNVLIYDEEYESRVNKKIEELLDLSVYKNSNMFYSNKPDIIIFPENSIPQGMIESLENYSKINDLLVIGGLEHTKEKNGFVNKVIIIDKGKRNEQIKQTPVWIWDKGTRNYLKENIKCKSLPELNIFNTSIGRIAIFICKDFLRLSEIIPYWVERYQVEFIIIPSLTTKVLPFQARLLSVLNYPECRNTKFLFVNIGEYGGSELFSIKDNLRIEENFRRNFFDNIGETIVIRKIERIKSKYLELVYREMEKYKDDPDKQEKLNIYKKQLEKDHIPYAFTKNLSLGWFKDNPHIEETFMIKATELFGGKLDGYCIRCKEKIPLNRYKPFCYNDWQDWVRWNNPFYVEKYCHKCGEPNSVTTRTPLCNNCYWN